MIRRASISGLTQRGVTSADYDFTVAYQSEEIVVSGESSSPSVSDDQNIIEKTLATVYDRYDLQPEIITPPWGSVCIYEALNPSVAIVDVNTGETTRVSDGQAYFLIHFGPLTKKVGPLDFTQTGGNTTTEFVSWVDGSLMKECVDAVDNRIDGLTPSEALRLYTSQNHTGASYVRNLDFWATDVDLTCISPWNETGGGTRAGTAITKDAVVFAEHYQITTGDTIRFVTADNQVVTRTVTAKQSIGPSNSTDSYATDITVGLLDSDLPVSITPCKLLPADISDYLPSLSYGCPALCLDQEEKGLITDLYNLSETRALFKSPTGVRFDYYENKISGDSGNPAFLIIDGQLVLITTWTYGGAGIGPNYAANLDAINSALSTLGSAYQVDTISLSAYINYE